MDSETTQSWWLSIDGRADGPHSEISIVAALQNGRLDGSVHAWPEGGQNWQPLSAWPPFQALAPPPLPFSSLPIEQRGTSANDRLITNARLPAMANAICIFTIVVLPLYWLLSLGSTFVTNPSRSDPDAAVFLCNLCLFLPVDLAITGALVVGGLRLRNLRRSGPRLIRISVWCDLAATFVKTVLIVLMSVAMISTDGSNESQASDAETLVSFLTIPVVGAVFVFEIVVLVWLTKHEQKLALSPNV